MLEEEETHLIEKINAITVTSEDTGLVIVVLQGQEGDREVVVMEEVQDEGTAADLDPEEGTDH